jgi:hypothetical protein
MTDDEIRRVAIIFLRAWDNREIGSPAMAEEEADLCERAVEELLGRK